MMCRSIHGSIENCSAVFNTISHGDSDTDGDRVVSVGKHLDEREKKSEFDTNRELTTEN